MNDDVKDTLNGPAGQTFKRSPPAPASPTSPASTLILALTLMPERKISQYYVEYARSNRAKCRGPKPCHGTPISQGELRFGTLVEIRQNHSIAWRHWGCITSRVFEHLKEIYSAPTELEGYKSLQDSDKFKILKAWEEGRVAKEDIPESARKAVEDDGEKPKKKKRESGTRKKGHLDVKGGDEAKAGETPSKMKKMSLAGFDTEKSDRISNARVLESTLESGRNESSKLAQGKSDTDNLLKSLSERLDAFDKKLNRINGSTGTITPDQYLYPLPAPTPDKPANGDKLFWTKKSWKWKEHSLSYIINAEGELVPASKREEILTAARGLLSDSAIRAGWHTQTWEKCGDMMKDIFVFGIERKFPEVALCANHWKAYRIAEDCYESWREGFFRSSVDSRIVVRGGDGKNGDIL